MISKAQRFWDKQAKRFDNTDKQFEQANQLLIAKTKKYLNANDIVLDFGCATGTKTLKLADGIKHINGLDFSNEMITEALRKASELNVTNISFTQGTIFTNDLKESSYDVIIAYSIIHLLEDSDKVIHRIHELLKPGGLFISETACFKDRVTFKTRLQVALYLFMKRLGVFPLHLNMFNTSDLEQLIKSQNFNILKSENLFYNGMTITFLAAERL